VDQRLWVYDYRTNVHHTLKQNPLRYEDLADFIDAFHADNRFARVESERFHSFSYNDLLQRDKVSLDLIWLRDESLEDSANLPPPDVIAAEIVEDLEAALAEFAQIAASFEAQAVGRLSDTHHLCQRCPIRRVRHPLSPS